MGPSVRAIGWAAALTLPCACAGGGVASVRAPREPAWKAFAGAHTAALVHDPAHGKPGGPARDVVDGLGESLRQRGWEVRPARPEAAKALEALRDRVEAWGAPALDAHGATTTGVYEEAGEAVRAAGVDAVAFGWRFLLRPLPRDPVFGRPAGTGLGPETEPLGAIVLVGARGDVVRVEWGAGSGEMPANPAEAIDALLDAIAPRADDGVTPAAPPARAP